MGEWKTNLHGVHYGVCLLEGARNTMEMEKKRTRSFSLIYRQNDLMMECPCLQPVTTRRTRQHPRNFLDALAQVIKLLKKTHNESYFKTLQVVNIKRHGLINILSGQQGFIASSRPSALLVGFFTRSHCVAAPHRRGALSSHSEQLFVLYFVCASSATRQTAFALAHGVSVQKRKNRECFAAPPKLALSRRRCRGETHTGKFHTLFFLVFSSEGLRATGWLLILCRTARATDVVHCSATRRVYFLNYTLLVRRSVGAGGRIKWVRPPHFSHSARRKKKTTAQKSERWRRAAATLLHNK